MSNSSHQKLIDTSIQAYQSGDYEDAKSRALELLESGVKNTAIYNMLGLLYTSEYDFVNAEMMYQKAINIDKTAPQLYLNLGNVYLESQVYEKAQECYLKSIKLGYSGYLVYHNLAKLYMALNVSDKAQKMFDKAMALNATNPDLLFEYSLFLLKTKKYLKGFELYRYRYAEDKTDKQTYLQSRNNLLTKGTDVTDKTIFLTYEQGYGDIIQFVRYIPMFKKLGAKLYVQVAPLLTRLLQINYPDVVFLDDTQSVEYDYHMPLMDAAYYFATEYETIPDMDGYLHVDQIDSKRIEEQYFKDEKRARVGIVWRTNVLENESLAKQKERRSRNCTLEDFISYFNSSNVQLYSLQVNITDSERALLDAHQIPSLGDNFESFYDNALVIDNLDLIVGIDTVSSILAGAMGKETVIMLSSSADWRWSDDGSHINWFKSVTIFRQQQRGIWDELLEKVSSSNSLLSKSEKVQNLLAIAILYHQQKNLKDAERLYRKVLGIDAQNAVACHHLGLIAFTMGEAQHAVALIQEAIKIYPEYDEAYDNLKEILNVIAKKEIELNLESFAVHEVNTNFDKPLENYINEHLKVSQFDEHLKRLGALLKIATSVNGFSFRDSEYALLANMFDTVFMREDIERKYQVQYIGYYYNFYLLGRNSAFGSSLQRVSELFIHYIKIGMTVEALVILYDYITFMYWGLASDVSELKVCDEVVIKPFSDYLLRYFKSNNTQKRVTPSTREKKRVCYLGYITSYRGAYAVGRVMYSIFKGHYERNSGEFDFYYYAYGDVEEEFLKEIADFGFKIRRFDTIENLPQKLTTMRDAFFEDEIDIAVSEMPWGIPTYLFESRVAPVQLYISLGWHYWSISNLEQLIIPMDAVSCSQEYNQKCKNLSFGLDSSFIYKNVAQKEIEIQKKRYPKHKIIIGSIQRLVKVTPDYLEAIKSILKANENAIAILAGPGDSSLIDMFITEHDLDGKLFIPGLISPYVYAEIFDIYVDTFYFPGGHSCIEVMGKGKPVVSLFCEQWSGLRSSRIDELLVKTKDEYVEIVNKLILNEDFYNEISKKTKYLIKKYTDLSLHASYMEENFKELI